MNKSKHFNQYAVQQSLCAGLHVHYNYEVIFLLLILISLYLNQSVSIYILEKHPSFMSYCDLTTS